VEVEAVLRRRGLPAVSAGVGVRDDDAFITVEEPRVVYRGRVLPGRRKRRPP
jgi:hypothetical protein